jgi:predicted CoA-substrate-specific enzyme activase
LQKSLTKLKRRISMNFIGLDAGSVAVKVVVLDENGKLIDSQYARHFGHPVRVSVNLLKAVKEVYPEGSLSVTGSAGKAIAGALGIKSINEIVSQSYSIKKLFPDMKTVIEIGGEDSKLIILDSGKIKDFSMNSVCAAGTGSFLEQQAERLRLTIEEFSEIAARSKKPSKIAGRCSVFAKSDMIHLQQIATPVEDIVAGLCFAVARNFKGTIAKGMELLPPVAFQGGVAANKGMVRALKEVLELEDIFVPPHFALMCAIGAALKGIDEGAKINFTLNDLVHLESSLAGKYSNTGHAPLISEDDSFFERHIKDSQASSVRRQASGARRSTLDASRIKTYLGIDIGSISTNLAVIDEDGNLLAKQYLMTAGRPIDAVKQGLEDIYAEIGDSVEIAGVGTTGSGRYMIADYVGADIVKNEITAQATAAIYIDNEVDTIFEIGGQDSKYISIRDGVIVDFEMNKACAAGTGSFIEEQAEKLDISVKGVFADCSFRSTNPCRLGERCTVFMENSLMANLQRGADKDDLLAGLSYSIVQNYINRVVAGKSIGKNIFFQGGVAFNKAVVAAFEKYLGVKVTVPPNHDVTGAIGMALIARDYMKSQKSEVRSQKPEENNKLLTLDSGLKTKFKGFEFSKKPYEISSFECKSCPNVCEINRVKVQGEDGYLFYGGRCEKYDVRRAQKSALPDLFSFRDDMLWKAHNERAEERKSGRAEEQEIGRKDFRASALKIGIPYIFFLHDYLPFWSTILWELGFEVIVSPKTNKQIINLGVENVLSEACFPVKVAHGHIKYLVDAGVNAVFIPSSINLNQHTDEYKRGVSCPYVQTIPYVSKAALSGLKTITPVIDFSRGEHYLKKELFRTLKAYGVKEKDIEKAIDRAVFAQSEFQKALREKGREVLGKIDPQNPVIVIIGRGYNSFDSGVNLEIPKKLSNIDVLSVPMDMLPLAEASLQDSWPNMYWRSGQRILKAARIIRTTPGLYAIYIGNFSCGPDSFILKYFKKELEEKPFLHIEIDEHSADAGAITRCEAFLDSIKQQSRRAEEQKSRRAEEQKLKTSELPNFRTSGLKKRTIFIPRMTDHAFAVAASFERCGVPAEVLPMSDTGSVDIGKKYLSGKECYPCTVTTGDLLKKIASPDFIPDSSAFFMPTANGPCRFGQYHVLQKLIIDKLGYKDVVILAPEQHSNTFQEIGVEGKDFTKVAWTGIVAFDMLYKCLHEARPYEKDKGTSDSLFDKYRQEICLTLKGTNGNMDGLIKKMKKDFQEIPKNEDKKPLIGVVGEIFVRCHTFSNEDLVKKIEALGGEVWLAPMEEWIYYVNYLALRRALIKKDGSAIIGLLLKKLFQDRIEHKLVTPFNGFLKTAKEPTTKEILKKASPYVHDSVEGETVLSIGKAIDLIENGASGIVNVMPFGCMPGAIVAAFMKTISKEYSIPCISIQYDGTDSPTTELQLEAFMEAAHSRR